MVATGSSAEVGISLVVDSDKALASLKKVSSVVSKTLVAAAGAGAAAMAVLVKRSADAGDAAFNLGKRLGVTTEFLTRMQFAAGQTGVASATLNTALTALTRRASAMPKQFEKWGISTKDANGNLKTTEQLTRDVADRMKGLSSQADRLSLAQDLMSEAGRQAVPLLQDGAEALDNYFASADATGATISTTAAIIANEFNNSLDRTQTSISGASRILGDTFLPLATVLVRRVGDVARAVGQWIKANNGLIKSKVFEMLQWAADTVMPALGTGVLGVAAAWKGWGMIIDIVKKSAVESLNGIFQLVGGLNEAISVAASFYGADGIAQNAAKTATVARNLAKEFSNSGDAISGAMAKSNAELEAIDTAIQGIIAGGRGVVQGLVTDVGDLNAELTKISNAPTQAGGSPAKNRVKEQMDAAKEAARLERDMEKAKKAREKEEKRQREKELKKEQDAAKQKLREQERIATSVGNTISSSFLGAFKAAREGGEAFREYFGGLILSLVNKMVTSGIIALIGNLLSGGSLGIATGFISALGFSSGGMMGAGGRKQPIRAANGYQVPNTGTDRDVYPALLRRGEVVMTPEQMSQRGSGSTVVINAPMNMSLAAPTSAQVQRHIRDSVYPALNRASALRTNTPFAANRRIG